MANRFDDCPAMQHHGLEYDELVGRYQYSGDRLLGASDYLQLPRAVIASRALRGRTLIRPRGSDMLLAKEDDDNQFRVSDLLRRNMPW